MTTRRQRIEDAIEQLISALDEIDGDADFEPEPLEEQHDREPEEVVCIRMPHAFVIDSASRRWNGQ